MIHKVKRAGNQGGYSKPYPYTSPLDACKPNYIQANDKYVLDTYYKDGNSVNASCPADPNQPQSVNNPSGTSCPPVGISSCTC